MLRRCRVAGILVALLACAGAAANEAPQTMYKLSIGSQPMDDALNEFARQSGLQVVLQTEEVKGVTAPRVEGTFTARDALGKLLANSSLQFEYLNERTVAIRAKGAAGERITASGARSDSAGSSMQLARADTPDTTKVESAQRVEGETSKPAGTSDDAKSSISEIVVTAQKRAERLQDVPASITAITKLEIERRGLTNMDDYMRSVPGVSRMETGAGRTNPIVIRGLALSPENDKPGVGTYFDEIPLVPSLTRGDHSGSADVTLVDIEQIEVLKGPQGTLYGSGALGGIVRNRAVKPNLEQFEGRISAAFSDTAKNGGSNDQMSAVLNLPLVAGKLAVRAVGYRYRDSGYIKNVAGSTAAGVSSAVDTGRAFGATLIDEDDVGRVDRDGGRVAVLWRPTDAFSASYTYVRQLLEQTGVPEIHPNLGTYEQAYLQPAATAPRRLGQDTTLTINNLLLSYDFSWGEILSSSSHVKTKAELGRDVSYSGLPILNPSWGETEALTHEIRLSSNLEGPFEFLLGGFYEDTEVNDYNTNFWSGTVSSYPFPLGAEALPLFASALGHNEIEQKAVFGEVSFEFLDGFKATLGARRFDYDTLTTPFNVYVPAFGLNEQGPLEDITSSETGDVMKAVLSYKPSEDSLVYAQWSQGFRLGYAQAAPFPFCDPNGDGVVELVLPDGSTIAVKVGDLDSDRTDNLELGGKLDLVGGRVRINASVYQIDWDKFPITQFDAGGGCAATFNGGKARSQGVELETAFRVTSTLDLALGLSYMDAELTEDVPNLGAFSGDRLPGSPRFMANAALSYGFPLYEHDAFARADMLYVGEYYNNLQQAGLAAGGYFQLNLRSGITVGKVDFELYANNVTGADELTWVYSTITADGRGFRLRPRTIGAQLIWSF